MFDLSKKSSEVFSSFEEMKAFLDEMEAQDKIEVLKLANVKTLVDESGPKLICGDKEFPLWDFKETIRSLEERSQDDAIGHKRMSLEQVLNSMNNYWALNTLKSGASMEGKLLVRGSKGLVFNSSRYQQLPQNELIEFVSDFIEKNFDYSKFESGSYSHEMTSAVWNVDSEIIWSEYKKVWEDSGFGAEALEKSQIYLKFLTNDIGSCCAMMIPYLVTTNKIIHLGDPVSLKHHVGAGDLGTFKKSLDSMFVSLKEEMTGMSKLMSVKLKDIESATVNAMKAAGLIGISKKACKELIDGMFYMDDSAFSVYIYLHSFFDMEHARTLSDERIMRAHISIRRLIKANWNEFDVPTSLDI